MTKKLSTIKFSTKTSSLLTVAAVYATTCFSATFASAADAPVYPTDLTNVALAANGGKIISSTSTFESSPDWSATNLIDGKVFDPLAPGGSLGWSSDKFDPITMDSVTIGFGEGQIKRIGRIVLNPGTAVAPERWAKDVEVQVTKDSAQNGPYRTVGMLTLTRDARPQSFLIFPADAKYVRLVFRTNQGSDRAVALGEVEMYESIPQNDAIGQLIASMTQAISELKQYKTNQDARFNTRLAQGETPNLLQNIRDDKSKNAPSAATIQLVQMMAGDAIKIADTKTADSKNAAQVNIAAAANGGKIMSFSSVFDSNPVFGAANLIDGKVYDAKEATSPAGWASEGFAPGREFVTIGFGDNRSHLIGKLVLNPSSNQAILRWARGIDVQATNGSIKEGPWKTVASLTLRSNAFNQEFEVRPFEAKYVRFVFQSNGPSDINLPGLIPGVSSDRAVSLGEIEIYEATSNSDALDAVIGRFESILVDLTNFRKAEMKKVDTEIPNAKANVDLM